MSISNLKTACINSLFSFATNGNNLVAINFIIGFKRIKFPIVKRENVFLKTHYQLYISDVNSDNCEMNNIQGKPR